MNHPAFFLPEQEFSSIDVSRLESLFIRASKGLQSEQGVRNRLSQAREKSVHEARNITRRSSEDTGWKDVIGKEGQGEGYGGEEE